MLEGKGRQVGCTSSLILDFPPNQKPKPVQDEMNPVNEGDHRNGRTGAVPAKPAEKIQIEEVSPRTGGEHGLDLSFQQPGK